MGFYDRMPDRQPEVTSVQQELKRSRFFGWRDVVICVVIVGVFLLMRNTGLGQRLGYYGGLSPVLEEKQFGITGLDGVTHTFVYADSDIELYEGLKEFLNTQKGETVDAQETRQVYSGTYRNDAFGEYQLHVQIRLNSYIVVHNADGVLVFNLESDDTTQELYRYFMQLREAQLAGQAAE